MKETLERLWKEYLSDQCAVVDTEEEQILAKKAAQLHEKATAFLKEEQKEAVEQYVDALYDMEAVLVKKAFFAGCEFGVSFLLETGHWGK